MQRFKLLLTTEELKELQLLLEASKVGDTISWSSYLDDVMTKVIVTQVEAETPFVYVGAYPEADRVF